MVKVPGQRGDSGVLDPLDADMPPMPSERATGLVFAAAAGIAALLFRSNASALAVLAATASAFTAVALAQPHWLAPLNRAWFALALLLNRIVSPVIMFILFAGLIVPAGLVMQMRRDPLRAKRQRALESYWIERPPAAPAASMRDQF